MKIKLPSPILISILFLNTVVGQTQNDAKKNTLEFSTGYNYGALKNLEFAPVSRYDYNGLVYKLNYERVTKRNRLFEVQLDHLQSELKTDVIPVLNSDYAKIGLSFSSLRPVYTKNKFSVHLGVRSYTDLSLYSESNNYRSVAEQTFGAAGRFSYRINEKQALCSQLTIPVVLVRITSSSDGIYSLNRYQSVLWNIGYKYSLSDDFDMGFSYGFNYDRLQIPNAFREVQYQFNLGFNYKF